MRAGDKSLSPPRSAPRGPAGGPDRAAWARRPCRVGKDDLLGAVCCPDLHCACSHAVAHTNGFLGSCSGSVAVVAAVVLFPIVVAVLRSSAARCITRCAREDRVRQPRVVGDRPRRARREALVSAVRVLTQIAKFPRDFRLLGKDRARWESICGPCHGCVGPWRASSS
jgi:alcohol dehydrogenase class IV